MNSPVDRLIDCVVRLVVLQSDGRIKNGTGFFVSPGRILTCAHVIEESGKFCHVDVELRGSKIGSAKLIWSLSQPYPDIALISVDFLDHSCAVLGPEVRPAPGDRIFSYGFPADPVGVVGSSMYFEYQGLTHGYDNGDLQQYYGVNADRVIPGVSGAPLLCLRTWKVFGILKHTHSSALPVGGRGVGVIEAVARKPTFLDDVRIAAVNPWRVPDPEDSIEICPEPLIVDSIVREPYDSRIQSEAFWGMYNGPIENSDIYKFISSLGENYNSEVRELKNLMHPSYKTGLEPFTDGLGCHQVTLEGHLTIRNYSARTLTVKLESSDEVLSDQNLIELYESFIPSELPWLRRPEQIRISFGPRNNFEVTSKIPPNDEESFGFVLKFWIGQIKEDAEIFNIMREEGRIVAQLAAAHLLANISAGMIIRVGASLRVSSKPLRRNVSFFLSPAIPPDHCRVLRDVPGFLTDWYRLRSRGMERYLQMLKDKEIME